MSFVLDLKNKYKLITALEKVTAAKMHLYRGVQDVMPSDMQKYYKGDGIFGSGMYFAFDYDDAENYMLGIDDESCRYWGIVGEYNFDLGNSIELTPSNANGIEDGMADTISFKKNARIKLGSKVKQEKLTELANKKGFDSIVLKIEEGERPDGGEQVILLSSKIKPILKSLDIYFMQEGYAEKLSKLIKIKSYNKAIDNIPVTSLKKVDAFLQSQNWKDDDNSLDSIFVI